MPTANLNMHIHLTNDKAREILRIFVANSTPVLYEGVEYTINFIEDDTCPCCKRRL